MQSRAARAGLVIVGVIAVVVGGVWVGQGLNLIPGSFMTGDRFWLAVGAVVAVVGLILVIAGLRPRRRVR